MNNASLINTSQVQPGHAAAAVESLSAFIKSLLKKWWLFLIVGLLGGTAGYFYAKRQKLVYQSRLTFALDDAGENGGLSGAFSLASQFGLNLGTNSNIFSGDNIIEILKSRRMVEKVLLSVDTFNGKPFTLIGYFRSFEKPNPKAPPVNFLPGQDRNSFSFEQDSVLYGTYQHFVTAAISAGRPDKKLMIYEVNIVTGDEKLSKVFTDRLIAETNNFYIEISSKKAKLTLDILEERVAAMKGNVNASISSKALTQDANLNPAMSSSQIPIVKQQVNMQVYSGAYAEMFKNLEMARFQYLNKIPLMQIIDQADYPMKKVVPSKLKMAAISAFIACILVVFILWIIRIGKMNSSQVNKIELVANNEVINPSISV